MFKKVDKTCFVSYTHYKLFIYLYILLLKYCVGGRTVKYVHAVSHKHKMELIFFVCINIPMNIYLFISSVHTIDILQNDE